MLRVCQHPTQTKCATSDPNLVLDPIKKLSEHPIVPSVTWISLCLFHLSGPVICLLFSSSFPSFFLAVKRWSWRGGGLPRGVEPDGDGVYVHSCCFSFRSCYMSSSFLLVFCLLNHGGEEGFAGGGAWRRCFFREFLLFFFPVLGYVFSSSFVYFASWCLFMGYYLESWAQT